MNAPQVAKKRQREREGGRRRRMRKGRPRRPFRSETKQRKNTKQSAGRNDRERERERNYLHLDRLSYTLGRALCSRPTLFPASHNFRSLNFLHFFLSQCERVREKTMNHCERFALLLFRCAPWPVTPLPPSRLCRLQGTNN